MKYTDVWNNLTKRIGYWVDMDNPYITYKSKYIESVWSLLKKLYNDNLIYKGSNKSVHKSLKILCANKKNKYICKHQKIWIFGRAVNVECFHA